jgi:hypothetical protein
MDVGRRRAGPDHFIPVLFFDYSTVDDFVDEQVLKTCSRTILHPSLKKCYNIDNTYIVDKEAP